MLPNRGWWPIFPSLMSVFGCFVVVSVSYIIGSVSFGAIVARINGVDIFSSGSGSSGATNVKRTLGRSAACVVFFLDFLKGLIPCLILAKLEPGDSSLNTKLAMAGLCGILLGHSLSIFHKFRGGKGIASTMGGLLVIMPRTLIVGALVWAVVFYATRMSSMASLCFSGSLLLTSYLFEYPAECVLFSLLLNVIIFWRHKENIIRMANGTEYKFEKKG
jgi:glycerol-3-phosphate acyltransferase PlsY